MYVYATFIFQLGLLHHCINNSLHRAVRLHTKIISVSTVHHHHCIEIKQRLTLIKRPTGLNRSAQFITITVHVYR